MLLKTGRRRVLGFAVAAALSSWPRFTLSSETPDMTNDRNSMFPKGHLKVLGFFDQPDREWYEAVHAPDFLSFAAPHMARYTRNWVTGVRLGTEPAFSVLTEIHFASEAAKLRVRELMATPVARPLLDHTMEQRAKRGIVEAEPHSGLGLFPVVPQPAVPQPQNGQVARQAVLLRRAQAAGHVAFEVAAGRLARELSGSDARIAVVVDIAEEGEEAPADAVIYVGDAADLDLSLADRPELDLVSILDVETVSSAVGGPLAG